MSIAFAVSNNDQVLPEHQLLNAQFVSFRLRSMNILENFNWILMKNVWRKRACCIPFRHKIKVSSNEISNKSACIAFVSFITCFIIGSLYLMFSKKNRRKIKFNLNLTNLKMVVHFQLTDRLPVQYRWANVMLAVRSIPSKLAWELFSAVPMAIVESIH